MEHEASRADLFEGMYAGADSDAGKVPWALLRPNPALEAWLDAMAPAPGRALVVAVGLGDDAEELARRGWRVTGFDVSATAIDWCRRRFPDSSVDYRVADLFAPPPEWSAGFDLVVEIRTLQSLEPQRRADATASIADWAAPGGLLFVHCLLREEGEAAPDGPPQPLTLRELAGFERAGLERISSVESPSADGRGRSVSVGYRRTPPVR